MPTSPDGPVGAGRGPPVGRVLVVFWQVGRGVLALGVRLALARLSRHGEPPAKTLGRTLATTLERLGPTYVKLGQLLSTRSDLMSEPLLLELARLQDDVAPPRLSVHAALQQELGIDPHDVFSHLETRPIASASIAVIYRGLLRDGRAVAVKVRRPGIERRMRQDLWLLKRLVAAVGRLPPLRLAPLREAIDQVGDCLLRQLDFELEARGNRRLRMVFADDPNILIPALEESLCGPSIVTMDFVADFAMVELCDRDRRQALRAALRAIYHMIFVEGLVHCDLHRGNLRLLPGGQAALLDFGFMARLTERQRTKFVEFFLAMARNDGARCARITVDVALSVPDTLAYEQFEREVMELVSRVSGASVADFTVAGFVTELFGIQYRYGIRGTTEFTMAIIALLVFEGLANTVDPTLDFQRAAEPFLLRIAAQSDPSPEESSSNRTASEPAERGQRPAVVTLQGRILDTARGTLSSRRWSLLAAAAGDCPDAPRSDERISRSPLGRGPDVRRD